MKTVETLTAMRLSKNKPRGLMWRLEYECKWAPNQPIDYYYVVLTDEDWLINRAVARRGLRYPVKEDNRMLDPRRLDLWQCGRGWESRYHNHGTIAAQVMCKEFVLVD